jgi:flagellar biosynthesis protein FlhF
MRLKSFYAPTMADAMDLVRTILGEDAIIVATREEADGVRVTAAVEDGAAPPPPRRPTAEPKPDGGQRPAEAAAEPAAEPPPPQVTQDMLDQVGDALYRLGVPAAVSEKLVAAMEGLAASDPVVALAAGLSAVYRFDPLPPGKHGMPIALVGPPGSGKTLAIAKLATRAVMNGKTVGLVTTDTVRAGGVEQLAGFARLLKVKLVTVDDPSTLPDALAVHRGCDQVWIDTAGRNPFDRADMDELAAFLRAAAVEPVLVMPAGGDPAEAAEIAQAFRSLGAKRILPTRIDASRRYGGFMAAAHDAQLAFSDASQTSKVPNGLTPLTPVALARLLLPEGEAGSAAPQPEPAKASDRRPEKRKASG